MRSGVTRSERFLEPRAVEATRRSVRLALALEAGGRLPDADFSGTSPRPDDDDLLAVIRRHRVAVLLHSQRANLDLSPMVRDALGAAVVRQQLGAMRVAKLTLEVMAMLQAHGVRALALKGVALGEQTTGDFAARGVGDVDIWVAPNAVADTARLVTANGFTPVGVVPPRPTSGRLWRAYSWIAHESSWQRSDGTLDLHWALGTARGSLPSFDEAWSRRVSVNVANTSLPTLSPRDALDHSCAHTMGDGWFWLRSLLDVHRLARREDLAGYLAESARDHPATSLSLAITDELVGLPASVSVPVVSPRALKTARMVALHRQSLRDFDYRQERLADNLRKQRSDRLARKTHKDDIRSIARLGRVHHALRWL